MKEQYLFLPLCEGSPDLMLTPHAWHRHRVADTTFKVKQDFIDKPNDIIKSFAAGSLRTFFLIR
jgi:hypothetical protein